MNSSLFKNISVAKKKDKNVITEGSHTIYYNQNEMEHQAILFLSSLDDISISDKYDKLSYHLGNINPNKIVPYTDKLFNFRISQYAEIILPHLTDQNIIKFKNIISGFKESPELQQEIYNLIEKECQYRYTTEYVKMQFFNSGRNMISNNPFNNFIINQLYSSNYHFDCNMGCILDSGSILEVLENITLDEVKHCRDNIHTLFMSLVNSTIRQAENIYRMVGENYNVPNMSEILRSISTHIISGCDNNCLRIVANSAKIAIEHLNVSIKSYIECQMSLDLINSVIQEFKMIIGAMAISVLENSSIDYSEFEELEEDRDDLVEIENDFADKLITLFFDDNSPEIEIDQLEDMLQLSYLYESKIADKTVRGIQHVEKGTRKLANGSRDIGKDVKKIHVAASKIPEPFTNLVKNTYEKMKNMDRIKRKEALLSGGFKGRLLRVIRLGIKLSISRGLWSLLGPVYGSIAILVQFAISNDLDNKVRREIIDSLETELKIVNEKIDDSRGDNDKKAKYELMRIQSELEREIKRVKPYLGR